MLNKFSAPTLNKLQKDNQHTYYVYCLVGSRNNQPFYVGKGRDNRVFAHRQAALNLLRQSNLLKKDETVGTLKIKAIQEINALGMQILSYILSYGLSEAGAFASENVLTNYARLIQRLSLANLVKGYGSKAMLVGDIEECFSFQPMSIGEIVTDELIPAVKVRDAFRLSKDETKEYPLDNTLRDVNNLKSRTSGNWVTGRDKIYCIRYTITINIGADNVVVAAYKVSSKYSESKIFENGLICYAFQALPSRKDTLKELNLYKKCLPRIKSGSGSAVAYISN